MAAMLHSFLPENGRLAAVRALGLLDTPPEAAFEALTSLAMQFIAGTTALLTLVDRDRLWVKAGADLHGTQVPRREAFCDRTIACSDLLVVEDCTADQLFRTLPLVTQKGVRFYAGLPIHVVDDDGVRQPVGALCVMADAPRGLDARERATLSHLATLAESLLASRVMATKSMELARESERQAAIARRHERALLAAERMAMIGSWRLDIATRTIHWSDNVYRIHDLPIGSPPPLDEALTFYPDKDRAAVRAAIDSLLERGGSVEIETDFVTAAGRPRRVRSVATLEVDAAGRASAILGVFQDITERHEMVEALRRSADHDALTGIANRAAFDRAIGAAIDHAHRTNEPLLLVTLDLDGFKAINDTLGHQSGDDVLRDVAQRLRAPWLRGSFAARTGGDEFALLVTDRHLHDVDLLVERLMAELRVDVTANGLTLQAGASVGAARLTGCHASARDLIHDADVALYAAKRARVGDRRRGADRRRAA